MRHRVKSILFVLLVSAYLLPIGYLIAGVLGTSPSWTFEGSAQNEALGESVTMGDVNGDGVVDLIVGSPYRTGSTPFPHTGEVLIFLGAAAGPATTPSQVLVSTNPGFASAVVALGDFNGDSYGDVAVSSTFNQFDQVEIYFGSPLGLSSSPGWSTTQDSISFGQSLGAAGDVNGDGYADLLVGSPNYNTSSFTAGGRAYLFLGGPAAPTTPAWTFDGDATAAVFGAALAAAGDVNRDGYGDVIVSEPGWQGQQGIQGKALVFLGIRGGLSATPVWTNTGPINSTYGSAVGSAGDVNGDGYDDIVVGDNQASVGVKRGSTTGLHRGKAYVYYGSASGPSKVAAWTATGQQDDDWLGDAVASGDFNRDGFSDLIVSAPHEPQLNPLPGQIYLFLGSAKGLGKSAAWTIQGGQPGAGKAGFTLAVGDTTRDALRDLLVGMPGWNTAAGSNVGRAVLFLGGAN